MNDVYIMFLCKYSGNIIKDQITFNERSMNVTGRTFFHNFERMFPVNFVNRDRNLFFFLSSLIITQIQFELRSRLKS